MKLTEAATRVGGTVTKDGHIVVRDVTFALVPGGDVTLGWDGARTTLDDERRAAWGTNAAPDETFEGMLRAYLGPRRILTTAPFLIETTTQPVSDYMRVNGDDLEAHVRSVISSDGWRLPTNDEWEVAARAGNDALFAWGDEWPDGAPTHTATRWTKHQAPNPLGIIYGDDPYKSEIVDEIEWLRHGDGGTAICGARPDPEAWYSFAHPFQCPRFLWENVVVETYEDARARRALTL